MKEIPITQGKVALVDDEDFVFLNSFKWTATRGKRKNGQDCFYAYRSEKKGGKWRPILMHRIILDAKKGQLVDHRNHDCLDNRRSNLRLATQSQVHANRKISFGSSKYKGVSWFDRTGKWVVYIRIQGKQKNVGYFETEEEAARAYDAKARELFGEFARLNFPDREPTETKGF